MPLVYAAYAPNAPFLIDPSVFGGAGDATVRALRELRVAEEYDPELIVVASPHWVTPGAFRVNVSASPQQLYDFAGFPEALRRVRYAPKGDPAFGERLVAAGLDAGVSAEATSAWGLDHGAWAPLLHLFPGARTPVVPISIQPPKAELHVRWGEAMRAVFAQDPRRLALVATGSVAHNFARMDPTAVARWPEGAEIEERIVDRLVARDVEGLVRFDRRAWALVQPEGDLGPAFVLLGALGPAFRGRVVSREWAWGGISLTTVEFLPNPPSEN